MCKRGSRKRLCVCVCVCSHVLLRLSSDMMSTGMPARGRSNSASTVDDGKALVEPSAATPIDSRKLYTRASKHECVCSRVHGQNVALTA